MKNKRFICLMLSTHSRIRNLKRVLATKKEIDKYGLTKNDLLVPERSLNFEGAAKASKIPERNELDFESALIKVSPDLKTSYYDLSLSLLKQ